MERTLCPTLVGRDAEVAALREAMDASAAGSGGLVFLLGDAGVGKSRLASEARALAADVGFTVLAGRAVERAMVAYRPLSEALRAAFRDRPLPEDPSLDAFRPALARLLPESGTPGDATALVVAEAVTRLLASLGRGGGALLLIEDLHWADPDTMTVVEYLADHLGGERALCLATIRTGESYAVEAIARRLAERRAGTLIELPRLSSGDAERMVAECLGDAAVPADVRKFVEARAEGVPLFVEEILAGLVGARALVRGDDGWRVEGDFVAAVPLTFKEAVERRLSGLDEHARAVVRAAAVLGRRFDWAVLPGVTELPEETVLGGLRHASELQLLTVDADSGGFRFRHALSRDVVLEQMLPPERRHIAARALAALERASEDLSGDALALAADVAEQAGLRERASALLLRAADQAIARGAPASAEATLERARRLAHRDAELVLRIDEAAAEAAALAGNVDRAVERAERVLAALAWGAAPVGRRARLHLVLARAAVTAGRWAEATRHIGEAGALGRGVADAAIAARADALASQVAIAQERLPDAHALARAAIDRAEAAGVPEAACEALEVLGRQARLSDLGGAEEYFTRALGVAERHGLPLWRARALHELGTIDLQTGKRRGWLERARDAAVEAGSVAAVAMVDLHLAAVAMADWRPDDALPAMERCVDLSRRLGLSTYGMGLVHLGAAHGMLGNERAMERALEEALARCGDDPEVQAGAPGRARFMLDLYRADLPAALEHLDEAVAILRPHPALGFPFRAVWALLRTAESEGGDAARSEVRAAPGADNTLARFTLQLADAIAFGRSGRADEAVRALEAASRSESGTGAVWRAVLLGVVGKAALRDAWGDGGRMVRECLSVFDEHRLEALSSWCRSALRSAGEKVPRRGRGDSDVPADLRASGVSSREVDVLALIMAGLSNRDVGARLHLSPRTVERHVANLLVKTGASDRRELARLGEKAGVIPGA